MRFVIFQGRDGEWYLRLVARNGEIVLSSEGHKNRVDVDQLRHHILNALERTVLLDVPYVEESEE